MGVHLSPTDDGEDSLEVIVVRDDGISQLDHGASSLLEGLLQQDRLQGGVKLLCYVLQQTGLPKPHSVLKTAEEVFVSELHNIQSMVFFLVEKCNKT